MQGVIFEDFGQKHGFPGPLETILRQFTAQLRKSKDERNGAKHSPFNCDTANSKIDCAASKKAKSGAARKRGAQLRGKTA